MWPSRQPGPPQPVGETLTVEGDLALLSGATLGIDMAASTHDMLAVAGSASLAGSLNLSFHPSFAPTPGESWEIMDVGGLLTGAFTGLPQGSVVGAVAGLICSSRTPAAMATT